MSSTYEIGKKLVELCRAGKAQEAVDTLYSRDIVTIEAAGSPNMPQRQEGIEAVRKKGEWWEANHEIHRAEAQGPYPNGDRFIVHFTYDVTVKAGPMAGKQLTLDETGLYTVQDGKIVQEEFFYHMG